MDADRLFSYVVRDLADRAGTDDEYELLRASGLLRLLLADQVSLLDSVRHGRKVWFDVNDPYIDRITLGVTGDAGAAVLGDGMFTAAVLVPDVSVRTRVITLPAFLATTAADSSWTGEISVKLILRVTTVAFGGVHFAEPVDSEDAVLAKVLRYAAGDTLAGILRQVVAVTAVAMLPLLREADAEAVRESLRSAGLRKLQPGHPSDPPVEGVSLLGPSDA